MPSTNTDTQRKSAFFHSLGKSLTSDSNLIGNELYKSSHNVSSKEVWIDDIPFSPTYASASAISDDIVVKQIGTQSNPFYLYPLSRSNYQTWFIDTGTPSVATDGFIPSSDWINPLINPTDVVNELGAPSDGFSLKMYKPDGTPISYEFAYYEIDYFSGLIRFDVNRTPKDSINNNGLNFQFNQVDFQTAALSSIQLNDPSIAINYIKNTTTGGPRVVAWQYVGMTLDNIDLLTTNLTLEDYNTGLTVSGVNTIIIKGGSVTTPSGVTDGVVMKGQSPVATVWIPAPIYSDYFNPSFFTGTDRYVSNPDNNTYLLLGNTGDFGIGDWTAGNISRSVFNDSNITAFSDTDFACFNTGTTMSFTLYDDVNNVISSIDNFVIDSVTSSTSNGLTLNVTSFSEDSDRYKASINGEIDVLNLLPNGGRISWSVIHYNNEGPGNIASGVYSYTSSNIFYDSPSGQLTYSSTAKINGITEFGENTPQLKKYSGVSFYDINSTFKFSVWGIDNLNEITYPIDKQIDITDTNMAISGDYQGHSDGSTGKYPIINWTSQWNSTNLTYSVTATVDESELYIPNFENNTSNIISSTPSSYITTRIYDYGVSDIDESTRERMLFDTTTPESVTHDNNPINSEEGRLSTTDVMNSGTASFDSNSVLASDELQYIFGRIIYPQFNFNQFLPSDNNSVDYSSLTGSSKMFNVYTNLSISPTTYSLYPLGDYRWFVSSYGKSSTYNTSFSNGIFTFNSNFLEEDLHYNGITGSDGNYDLVIFIGIDSSGANATPDSFLFVTGDPISYPGRTAPTIYNLNEIGESSKKIQFTFGNIPIPVTKIWLFIGYKNSVRGKNLRISNINLS